MFSVRPLMCFSRWQTCVLSMTSRVFQSLEDLCSQYDLSCVLVARRPDLCSQYDLSCVLVAGRPVFSVRPLMYFSSWKTCVLSMTSHVL